MARLLFSFAFAAVAYELYWQLLSRRHGVSPRWFGRSRAEQRLREGGSGFLRLVGAWGMILIVYAFGTESMLPPFTAEWWSGAIGMDEWIFIAAMAPLLAGAEWCLLRDTPRRIKGQTPILSSSLQSAP